MDPAPRRQGVHLPRPDRGAARRRGRRSAAGCWSSRPPGNRCGSARGRTATCRRSAPTTPAGGSTSTTSSGGGSGTSPSTTGCSPSPPGCPTPAARSPRTCSSRGCRWSGRWAPPSGCSTWASSGSAGRRTRSRTTPTGWPPSRSSTCPSRARTWCSTTSPSPGRSATSRWPTTWSGRPYATCCGGAAAGRSCWRTGTGRPGGTSPRPTSTPTSRTRSARTCRPRTSAPGTAR